MIHKFKTLGPAFLTALAVAVLMASTASAQFTSNKTHTILSGAQKAGTNDIFTAGEGFGGIACVNVTFYGTAISNSEATQELIPFFYNCKDSFGRTVDVDGSELTYAFTSGAGKGTLHLSGSQTLTVTSNSNPPGVICTIVIKSPQNNNGISYINLGGTKGIEITRHSTNIIATTSGGFFNCGVSNGEHKSGTYDGIALIIAKDTTGAAASISVD